VSTSYATPQVDFFDLWGEHKSDPLELGSSCDRCNAKPGHYCFNVVVEKRSRPAICFDRGQPSQAGSSWS